MGEAFWDHCIVDTEITRVLVLCKSHLDIGFTGFARDVRTQYLEHYIPRVIRTARQLQREGTGESLVWCAGSYIVHEYWRNARGAALAECEAALADGILAYHALPFTVHSEYYDAPLFASLLKDCRELDAVSGRRTRAAKMTDVPGHTCGLVPLLAAGGVEFLHWGINPASYAPVIPQCFRWRAGGSEIVAMYAGNGYGADVTLPDSRTRVVFMHGGDNASPPGIGIIRQVFRELRLQYPNATVAMGSLDDLADALLSVRASLPLVEAEIGDSWIHGVATDGVKTARFRELLRFRRRQQPGVLPREFDRMLALVGEHTWGMDIKTHLSDDVHWLRSDFDMARKVRPNYAKVEASWREQRAYLDSALAALPAALRHEAEADLAVLSARPWDLTGASLNPPTVVMDRFRASFNSAGDLAQLADPSGILDYRVAPEGFMKVLYHAYGHRDVMRYLREYCPWDGTVQQVGWAAWDMGKIGVPGDSVSGVFPPENARFKVDDTDSVRCIVRVQMEWAKRLTSGAGAPARLEVEYAFDRTRPLLEITIQWFDKPANRLPEAIIAHFHTTFYAKSTWRMNKLGLSVDPASVVCGGGSGMHAVDAEQSWWVQGDGVKLTVSSPDVPLLLPDDRELWHYDADAAQPAGDFGFCLSNNQWGTNYPQWSEGDFRCRFRFCWE